METRHMVICFEPIFYQKSTTHCPPILVSCLGMSLIICHSFGTSLASLEEAYSIGTASVAVFLLNIRFIIDACTILTTSCGAAYLIVANYTLPAVPIV